MDAPLDFEFEDPLLISPVIVKKRKKVIGLDDLLTDHYQEKSKVIERESKHARNGWRGRDCHTGCTCFWQSETPATSPTA
uniref:Uncharacterized protein n=1 Tax=Salix viminalis TaxID=40686 RepID=A0A6N2KPI5_SALVM